MWSSSFQLRLLIGRHKSLVRFTKKGQLQNAKCRTHQYLPYQKLQRANFIYLIWVASTDVSDVDTSAWQKRNAAIKIAKEFDKFGWYVFLNKSLFIVYHFYSEKIHWVIKESVFQMIIWKFTKFTKLTFCQLAVCCSWIYCKLIFWKLMLLKNRWYPNVNYTLSARCATKNS